MAHTAKKKKRRTKESEEAVQDKKNKKFVEIEAAKQLQIIKPRIIEAAKRGESWIDLFPTGSLGNALLDLLGSGFRADTSTTHMIGLSDGQGWSDGSYIAHTRLMWTEQ